MNYTPSQSRAIATVDRNLQIIACAGSGKTQVISRRIVKILEKHGDHLTRLEHAEKTIELKLADGIVVSGQIDLIRRTDTNEIAIVDF